MRRKCAEKSAASEWPCSGGAPHSLSAFSSRQHVTQPPLGRHTQGEHVSVHRDIFGLKCMLAFAPRFFKNKNPRKMSSAKPQPQNVFCVCERSLMMPNLLTCLWQNKKNPISGAQIFSQKKSQRFFRLRLQIAAFSRFRNRSVFGTLSPRAENKNKKDPKRPPRLSRPSKWTRRVWVANCC